MIEVGIPFSDPIADGSVIQESNNLAIENGMSSLRDAGIQKVKTGVSTIDEVLRATVEDI